MRTPAIKRMVPISTRFRCGANNFHLGHSEGSSRNGDTHQGVAASLPTIHVRVLWLIGPA